MIRRRATLLALAAAGLPARAVWAQPAKAARIGVLLPDAGFTPGRQRLLDELRAGLAERGWVPGTNLVIEIRAAESAQGQRDMAGELKAAQVALIVAPGTTAIRAARDGAPGTPVVMVNAGDAVGSGFAASLARPGGNLTGTTAAGKEVLAKQLELRASAAPKARKVGVLMNRANPGNGFFFEAMAERAKVLGVQAMRIEVAQGDELEAALSGAGIAALVVVGDPLFYRLRERITAWAAAQRCPAIYGAREYVQSGGLMFYNSDARWHWRSAAAFIDKILKGQAPAELPIQQPTQFEFVINQKAAKAMGLTLPPLLLLRADEVID